MKRKIQVWMLLMCCLLGGTMMFPGKVSASSPEISGMEESSGGAEPQINVTPSPAPEDGWVRLEDGRKKYFRDGQYVTGFQTIDGKTYYFNKYGVMARNAWVRSDNKRYRAGSTGALIKNRVVTINGSAYYFEADGAMAKGWRTFPKGKAYFLSTGIRAKGLTAIGGKYYYFTNAGYMATGTFTVNGVTYYMSDDGVMERRKEKSQYYDSSNNPMSALEAQNLETLDTARRIISQITTPGMSQSEKLYACFRWVMSKPYATRRKFNNFDGWPAVYANDHFIYGSGNCQSDAAAFAYLAYALGYDNVYVCADSTGWGLPHSWTEINGLVYDPLFAEAKSFSKNYGVRYGVYVLSPIVHIKMHG